MNIIITNRDFPKVAFKKKTVTIIAEPVLSLVVLAKFVWSLIALGRSLIAFVAFVYPLAVLVSPLVVLVWPHVVSVCPLAVFVVLSVGLFITDQNILGKLISPLRRGYPVKYFFQIISLNTQFNAYFITFSLISWNSCKICEDVEGFTTDAILLTAICSSYCTILLVIFNVSLQDFIFFFLKRTSTFSSSKRK